nr:hypothetical protein [Acinetobacter johnsonii]
MIDKWKEITFDKGFGRNINTTANKENYEKQGRLGIGDIRRTTPEQGNNALGAVAYLSDPDKYEQSLLVKPRGRKTFYKGIISIMVAQYLIQKKIEESKNGMRRPL